MPNDKAADINNNSFEDQLKNFEEKLITNLVNNYQTLVPYKDKNNNKDKNEVEISQNLILQYIFGLNKFDAKQVMGFQPQQEISLEKVKLARKRLILLFHSDKAKNLQKRIGEENTKLQDIIRLLDDVMSLVVTRAFNSLLFQLLPKITANRIVYPKDTWLKILEKTLNCDVENYKGERVGPTIEQFFTAFQTAMACVHDDSYTDGFQLTCELELFFLKRKVFLSDHTPPYQDKYTHSTFQESLPTFLAHYANCEKFIKLSQKFLKGSASLGKILFENQDFIRNLLNNKKTSNFIVETIQEFGVGKGFSLASKLQLLKEIEKLVLQFAVIIETSENVGFNQNIFSDLKTTYLLCYQFIFLNYLKSVVNVPKTDLEHAIKFFLNFIERNFNFSQFIMFVKKSIIHEFAALKNEIENNLLDKLSTYSTQIDENNKRVFKFDQKYIRGKYIDSLYTRVGDIIELVNHLGRYFSNEFDKKYIDQVMDIIEEIFTIFDERNFIKSVSLKINASISPKLSDCESRPDLHKFITMDTNKALLVPIDFDEMHNAASEADVASAAAENVSAVLDLTSGSESNSSQNALTEIYKNFIDNVIEVLLAKADYLVEQKEEKFLAMYQNTKKLESIPALAANASLENKKQHLFLKTAQALIELKRQPQPTVDTLKNNFNTILHDNLEKPLNELDETRSLWKNIQRVISDVFKRLVSQHHGPTIYDNFSSKKTLELIRGQATAIDKSLFFSKPVAKTFKEDSIADSACTKLVRYGYR